MNISTSSLLEMLSSNVATQPDAAKLLNSDVKVKIHQTKQTQDVLQLNQTVKNNTVSTVLKELFQNLSSGVKSNIDILNILKQNKNLFSFKNIATDIKIIVEFLEKNNTKNSSKHIEILKNSLLDIKNIKPNEIKNKLSNSGIFLEAKLLKEVTTIKEDLSSLKQNIKSIKTSEITTFTPNEKINITDKSNIPINLTNQIKQTVNEILSNIKIISQESIKTNNNITFINSNESITTPKDITKEIITKQDIKPTFNKKINTVDVENKEIIRSTLKQIKNLSVLLDKNNIKNNIAINLKEALIQVANRSPKLNILKQDILNIEDKVENSNLQKNIKAQIKQEVNELANTIDKNKIINSNDKARLINKINTIESKILLVTTDIKHELNLKHISTDIKTVILRLQEDNNNSPIFNKDIKIAIDKIQAQVEFFQLLSVAQNAPQTPLSILQDDIEDVDISFSKNHKNEHSCQINLTLKEYGELKILLLSDDKNYLNITIGIQDNLLKKKIQKSLQYLRLKLSTTGLALQNINLFDINNDNEQLRSYETTQKINFGLNIKA